MNDKQSFLKELTDALTERGISQTDIEPYIAQFDRFYDRMLNDNTQTAGVLGDIDAIADNIAAQVSDRYDAINRLAERTMTVDAVAEDYLPTTETDAVAIPDEDEYELVEEGAQAPIIPQDMLDELEADAASQGAESSRLPDYIPEEEVPNSKMFWVLFGISLPITLPLALVLLGVFGVMWGGLAALIALAIAALAVTVTAGTALTLVGVIYGAIQLFTSVAVGVYEIGIGIIVAGVAMFVGILLYNFAVRLVPMLIKLVWKLFKYVLGRLRELFDFLRRESVKL